LVLLWKMSLAELWHACTADSTGVPRLPHPAAEMLSQRPGAHGSWFVSDEHRVKYMAIPRAASTTLRGAMRDLGAPIRRRLQQTIFNNSAAIRSASLSPAQAQYFSFTFVVHPLHHLLDGFAFVQNGGPEGLFNASDDAWAAYRRGLAQVHKRSAAWLRAHLFSNPHLLPQAFFLSQARHPCAAGAFGAGSVSAPSGSQAATQARSQGGSAVRGEAVQGLSASTCGFDFIGDVGHFNRDWARLVAALTAHGVASAAGIVLGRYGERRSSHEREATLLYGAESIRARSVESGTGYRVQSAESAGISPLVPWPLPTAFTTMSTHAASPGAGTRAEDEAALLGFCRVRYTEFVCLGFTLPPLCAAQRQMLELHGGWLF